VPRLLLQLCPLLLRLLCPLLLRLLLLLSRLILRLLPLPRLMAGMRVQPLLLPLLLRDRDGDLWS
jgi:hypothetical protein